MGPRVLYLIDSLAAGGAERSLVDMAPHLVSLGVQLEVAVLLDRPGLGPELEAGGVPVHVIGGSSRARQYIRLARFLRRHRPDLLHTTLFESDVLGRLAAAPLRIPVVSTLANTPYGAAHGSEPGISPLRLSAARLTDTVTAKTVRRFHAVSQATADAYIQRVHLDPRKVEVIRRGRDQQRLGRRTEGRRRAVRTELGIGDGVPVIVAVGRQDPQKGFDVLVRSMPAVLEAVPSAVLLIAGREGRETETLHRLIDELGLAASARLLGERNDVPDVLAAAEAFVLSSYREGLPGVVLEAMALEAPVIASDLPTVREAVPDERYALLVPAGDPGAFAAAVVQSLRDDAAARGRSAAARRRFEEEFDIRSVCRAMRDFYLSALSA